MYRIIIFLIALGITQMMYAQKTGYPLETFSANYPAIKKGFSSVPDDSRLRCWWWLNSMTTKETITNDLEQMKANGYGGATIYDSDGSQYASESRKVKAGPVFMSPEWMELYKHAVREAQRLGIELSVNVQSGYNPGGPTITPELALKKIVYIEIKITGGRKIQVKLPQPESELLYKDIIVQAVKQPATEYPLKDKAIKNWRIKSLDDYFGMRGAYPLNKLREEYSETNKAHSIRKAEIISITDKFNNGVLTWDAPEGDWTIIRYGWTCTGARTVDASDGWEGLSLDHLNPEAFKKFSDDVIVPLMKVAQSAGNSLHFLQTDSWEMGMVSWTNNFVKEFRKFRGYDIIPYLPVLTGRIVESREESNRFLHDYRKTIGDCIAAYHYQLFSDLAHQYGMGIHPESGGPHSVPIDALKVMAISDYPQGEFWAVANTHRIKDDERLYVKQSACVAHTNGKRFVAAEGPSTQGPQWERSPNELKSNIDRVFCSGVNRIEWATFASSPKEFGVPGNVYPFCTHLNPNVTWWKEAGNFISYLNRCSYMLSQGLFVADVLYYYGDDVPNYIFLKEDVKDLSFGYDWDKCSKDALLNRVSAKDQRVMFPDGMSYRLLVLPSEEAIDLGVLRKVETLVKEGITVIGSRPSKATGLTNFPESDKEVKAIATRMWGKIDGITTRENRYGQGKVIWGKDVNTVLKEMKVKPDFQFTSTQAHTSLDYIHRTSGDMDIYFVVNPYGRKGINDFEYRYLTTAPDRFEQLAATFRIAEKVPELWDPMTGEIKELMIYREENGQTIIPINLEPEGSQFIVFRKAIEEPHIIRVEKDGKLLFPNNQFTGVDHPFIEIVKTDGKVSLTVLDAGNYTLTWSDGKTRKINLKSANTTLFLSGKWEVHFDPKWGGPEYLQIDTLKSWTRFEDEGIKYYSGRAVYKKSFSVSAENLRDKKVVIDLGNVLEMASIKINGNEMPVRWSAPFQFDVTEYVKEGDNRLEVEVVNLWPNRLIGDSKLPEEERFTKTNVIKFESPDSEKFLRESGLLGPVTLAFIHHKEREWQKFVER